MKVVVGLKDRQWEGAKTVFELNLELFGQSFHNK